MTAPDDELRGDMVQRLAASVISKHLPKWDPTKCQCGWIWNPKTPNFTQADHVAHILDNARLLA